MILINLKDVWMKVPLRMPCAMKRFFYREDGSVEMFCTLRRKISKAVFTCLVLLLFLVALYLAASVMALYHQYQKADRLSSAFQGHLVGHGCVHIRKPTLSLWRRK